MPQVEHRASAGEGGTQVLSVTRRSLVRTGAAAAWTAPLVQVLAPAPAQAVGSTNSLSLTGSFTHSAGARPFVFTGTITNNGNITTAGLQITVAWTTSGATSTWADNGGASAGAVTGWSNAGIVLSNGDLTATVTYTRTGAQIAAGGNLAFSATLTAANGGSTKTQSGSGAANVTATGFTSSATGNSYSG